MSQQRALTLSLPLPPRALSSNGSHGHWSVHARAAREYKALCRFRITWPANWGPFATAVLSYRFVYCPTLGHRDPRCQPREHRANCLCDYHPRDVDNAIAAAGKRIQDALVDAGCLVADDARHLSLGSVAIVRCRPKCGCGGRVEVTVAEVEG